MDPQILIERDADNRHGTGSHIADQRDGCQRRRGKDFVAVDDVLVGRDEDAEDAETKKHGGS